MESWSYAICWLLFSALCSGVQAAPVHETERLSQEFVNHGWIAELYQSDAEISVVRLADEEFRNIPQGQTISLDFGDENRELFEQLISNNEARPAQFHYDWIGHLFGLRTWNIGKDNSFFSLSVHSRSSVLLPSALPLFFGALALFCMALVFIKWRKSR